MALKCFLIFAVFAVFSVSAVSAVTLAGLYLLTVKNESEDLCVYLTKLGYGFVNYVDAGYIGTYDNYVSVEDLLKMFKMLLRNHGLYFEVSDGRMWTGKPMVWNIAVKCSPNIADWLCDWIEENK